MNVEKPTRYVIYGAGAIGIPVAGLLARAGQRVVCVARPAHAEALARGILIKEDGKEWTARSDAVPNVGDLIPETDDVAVITVKSQVTELAARELAERYGRTLPVVCLQNGVSNEQTAARSFERVYAGLVFFSAVQIEPSIITLPQGRTVAIGCYPTGLDDAARQFCVDLSRAGLDAIASAHIMAMKWGKLVANLNNATTAITGYFLEQAMSDLDMRRLMLAVREEGLRVLDAAGIDVEPPESEPSPIMIREMTEKLRQPPKKEPDSESLPDDQRTYSSMWQDLFLGRESGEADFLNGEIVALGKGLGIATPYNSTLLEIVNRMFKERLKPGIYTPGQLHDLIQSQSQ